MNLFLNVTVQLLEGLLYTLLIFGVTLLAALPLGLLIAFGSKSKIKIIRGIYFIILFKIFVRIKFLPW